MKFPSKGYKQFLLALKKERKIRIYKWLLTLPGNLKQYNINNAVWKYLLTFHIYYKERSSFTNNRNVCSFTGRTRSVYRDFQLNRLEIKKAIGAGMFFGVSKSSW
jgi:ribosomal protein S14